MISTIAVFNAHRKYRIPKQQVTRYVKRVLGARKSVVSVVFVDARYCRFINRTYLNHNYETDVISFVLESKPLLEGEIYVNLDKARKQAREFGVTFVNEVARLVIHGALHLIGYDDTTARKQRRMKQIEDKHVEYWFPPTQRNIE